MFENPRRGRQTRNFTTNVSKILDLKSPSEQIFFRKLSLGSPEGRFARRNGCSRRLARSLGSRKRPPKMRITLWGMILGLCTRSITEVVVYQNSNRPYGGRFSSKLRGTDTSTFWNSINIMQFLSYDMVGSIFSKFFVQGVSCVKRL